MPVLCNLPAVNSVKVKRLKINDLTPANHVPKTPCEMTFQAQMYGNASSVWDESLTGMERLRIIVNVFTRLRYCTPDGEMDFHQKGAPGTQPAPLLPWFDVPGRQTTDATVIFGHWSTLGLIARRNLIALDTGCLWGGRLTTIRLDDREVFAQSCS